MITQDWEKWQCPLGRDCCCFSSIGFAIIHWNQAPLETWYPHCRGFDSDQKRRGFEAECCLVTGGEWGLRDDKCGYLLFLWMNEWIFTQTLWNRNPSMALKQILLEECPPPLKWRVQESSTRSKQGFQARVLIHLLIIIPHRIIAHGYTLIVEKM